MMRRFDFGILALVVLVMPLASVARASAQERSGPAPDASERAAWGIYAFLEGKSRQAPTGFRILWQREGQTLYEHWIRPANGTVAYSNAITRGPSLGTLRMDGHSFGRHTWEGVIAADGSVAWTVPGKPKLDYQVRLGADASLEISARGTTTQYLAADGAGIKPDESAPAVDPGVWGVYGRLAGTTMEGRMGLYYYRWHWQDASTLVEERAGEVVGRSFIRADGAGGLSFVNEDGKKPRVGRVLPDGSVLWTRNSETYRVAIVPDGVDYIYVDVDGDRVKDSVKMQHLRGKLAERQGATSAPIAATPATATNGPAGPSPLGFRGLEHLVGKRLFSPNNRMYIELQHGGGATLLISMYYLDGKPYGRYVLAESREQPGKLTMLSSVVSVDHLDMTAEWKSDTVLALSSKSDKQGNWVNKLELRAEGDVLAYRAHNYREGPIAGESRTSGTYVTTTPELLAAAERQAAQLKANQEAAIAEAMASVVCTGSGVIGTDENGDDCATDGEWDANEDRASAQASRGDYGQPAESPAKALYDSLVRANAEADAHLARTQADYDATMAQARQQAERESGRAAGAGVGGQPQQPERPRQVAAAAQQPVQSAPVASQGASCTQARPRVDVFANTTSGTDAGLSLVRAKAAEFCRTRTGSPAYDGNESCSASTQFAGLVCKVVGECNGAASATCSNSQ
jgi:hypothetical protein